MMEHHKTPDSWAWTTLGQITEVVDKAQPRNNPKSSFIYIDISSIDNALNKIVEPKEYKGKDAPSRARQLVKADDILFSTVRVYLKNIALVEEKYDGQIASTGFCVIRLLPPIDPRFIFYYVITQTVIESLSKLQRGTSYPAVRNGDVFSQAIPIPPAAEQKRIVSKINALFSRLEVGVKSLSASKVKTEQYGSSLLRGAFRGDLTARWRKSNHYPPVQHSGSAPESLPGSWEWRKIGDVAEVASGSTPSTTEKDHFGGDFPWLTPADLTDFQGKFIERGARNLTRKGLDSCSARLLPVGTVLFSSRAPIGYVAIARNPISTNQGFKNLILNEGVFNEYVFYYLKGNKQLAESFASGTTFLELSASRMKKIPIPIPPLPEQEKIVEALDRKLSVIEATQRDIERSMIETNRFRESILNRAFTGQLVAQDPKDEPAEELLQRIREVQKPSIQKRQ